MEHRHHDLVVIGTGSGNSVIAPRLDHLDIGLVEKGRFGGTCLNVGCIPTKMFVLPADRVVDGMDAARFIQSIRELLECPALLFVEQP